MTFYATRRRWFVPGSSMAWICSTVVSLMMLVAHHGSAQVNGRPIASFDRTELDLGGMVTGERTSADVRIRNNGTGELKILSVETSCGCTTVDQPRSSIMPGGSGVIRVEFNSAGLEGPVNRQVRVVTNDPANQSTIVVLKTTISPLLDVVNHGSVIFLGNRTVGRWEERTINIRNVSSRPLMILGAESESQDMKVEVDTKRLAPSDTFQVRLRVYPRKKGPVVGSLKIRTDYPSSPVTSYKVTYNAK